MSERATKRGVRWNGAAALAAALLLSTGCATKRDLRDLRTELRALSARQDTILAAVSRQNAVTQDTLRQQTNQLFEIRGDVSRQLQRILDEITMLRELAGQNQRTIAALRDQVEGLRRGGGGAPPTTGEAVVGVQPGADAGGAAEALYNTAREQHNSNQLTTAQQAYQDFIDQYPNHELTPRARFYLADVLGIQGKTQEALDTYEKIPQLHPGSDIVGDALYRMALIDIDQGKRDEARRLLQRVVNSYPNSQSAGAAQEELRKLR